MCSSSGSRSAKRCRSSISRTASTATAATTWAAARTRARPARCSRLTPISSAWACRRRSDRGRHGAAQRAVGCRHQRAYYRQLAGAERHQRALVQHLQLRDGHGGHGPRTSPVARSAIMRPALPDVVINRRIDQTWGSAQIAGALHQVRAGPYGNDVSPVALGPAAFTGQVPADRWGFAPMGGGMATSHRRRRQGLAQRRVHPGRALLCRAQPQSFVRAVLALRRAARGAAWALDGIFANTVGPARRRANRPRHPAHRRLEHRRRLRASSGTRSVRSSLFGVFSAVSYPGQGRRRSSAPRRSAPSEVRRRPALLRPSGPRWPDATRTSWFGVSAPARSGDPIQNLELGAEVMYSRLDQNMGSGVVLNFPGATGSATGFYTPQNQSIWSGLLRFQWHFGTPRPRKCAPEALNPDLVADPLVSRSAVGPASVFEQHLGENGASTGLRRRNLVASGPGLAKVGTRARGESPGAPLRGVGGEHAQDASGRCGRRQRERPEAKHDEVGADAPGDRRRLCHGCRGAGR